MKPGGWRRSLARGERINMGGDLFGAGLARDAAGARRLIPRPRRATRGALS